MIQNADDKKRIWIHAVSVGEIAAISSIVDHYYNIGFQIFISCTTLTGFSLATKLYEKKSKLFYYPFDYNFICSKRIKEIDPDIICIVEIEIWPNFINTARKKNIPLVLINGRLGDKEYRNYMFFKSFFGKILKKYSKLIMQSERDANLIKSLGADSKSIMISGNIKFDLPEKISSQKRTEISSLIKRKSENELLIIAGSTHRGEETLILSIFKELLIKYPSLRLILVPRHPHRANEVILQIKRYSLSYNIRSKNELFTDNIWLIDTIGELMELYSLSDIVIMGGSFLASIGGHNIIEPAFYSKPIIIGPHNENFRDVAALFLANDGVIQATENNLQSKIIELIESEKKRNHYGNKAFEVISNNRGASQFTIDAISNLLNIKS